MKQFISLIVAAFCVTSVAQEVCRPPLVFFGVHREQLPNGWTHSTGGVARETRVVEVDYHDNREIVGMEYISYGSVSLTNVGLDGKSRRIKYRHRVSVPQGDYTVIQDSTDYEVCADNGEIVFYHEKAIFAGSTWTQEWEYSVYLELYGDFNNDGLVNGNDLGMFFASWGTSEGDLNGDGFTDAADLGILLENWRDD